MKSKYFLSTVLTLLSAVVFSARVTQAAEDHGASAAHGSGSRAMIGESKAVPKKSKARFLSPIDNELANDLLVAFVSQKKDAMEKSKKALQKKHADIDPKEAFDFYKYDFELHNRVESWVGDLAGGTEIESDDEFILAAGFEFNRSTNESALAEYLPRLEKLTNKTLAQFQIAKLCLFSQLGCSEFDQISSKIADPKVKVMAALHKYRAGDKDQSLLLLSELTRQGVKNSIDRLYFEAFDHILTERKRSFLHYQQYTKLYISLLDQVYANLYSVCRKNWSSKKWLDTCYKIGWDLFEIGDRNGQPILADALQYRPRFEHQEASDRFLKTQRKNQQIDREFNVCGNILSSLKNPKISNRRWSKFLADIESKGFLEANVSLCKSLA